MIGPPPLPEHAVDPICGREVPTASAWSVIFQGKRWFFCADPATACRIAFKRDPAGHAAARPDAGVDITPRRPAPAERDSPFVVRSARADDPERES